MARSVDHNLYAHIERAAPADPGSNLLITDNGAELRPSLVGRVVVDDPGLGLERLGEGPERDPVAVGQAPALESERAFAESSDELLGQARLADAGIGDDREEPGGARGARLLEELTNGCHPKAHCLARAKLSADNLARLLGSKAAAPFDGANRAIFLGDAPAWKAVHAAEKRHALGPPGEKYLKSLRLSLPQ